MRGALVAIGVVGLVAIGVACKTTQQTDTAPPAAPSGSTPQTRTRSRAAADVLVACKMAEPPTACTSDADCSGFEVSGEGCGECPITFHFGVTASQKAAYLARNGCRRPLCTKTEPLCVVHWQVAEDGRPSPTGQTPVRCAAGACVTEAPKAP